MRRTIKIISFSLSLTKRAYDSLSGFNTPHFFFMHEYIHFIVNLPPLNIHLSIQAIIHPSLKPRIKTIASLSCASSEISSILFLSMHATTHIYLFNYWYTFSIIIFPVLPHKILSRASFCSFAPSSNKILHTFFSTTHLPFHPSVFSVLPDMIPSRACFFILRHPSKYSTTHIPFSPISLLPSSSVPPTIQPFIHTFIHQSSTPSSIKILKHASTLPPSVCFLLPQSLPPSSRSSSATTWRRARGLSSPAWSTRATLPWPSTGSRTDDTCNTTRT